MDNGDFIVAKQQQSSPISNGNGPPAHGGSGNTDVRPPDQPPPAGAGPAEPAHTSPVRSDYPTPRSLTGNHEFVWDEDDSPQVNYQQLGRQLAAAGDLYRRPAYAGGLLLASPEPNV